MSMAMTRDSGPCWQRWRPARIFMLSSRSCALDHCMGPWHWGCSTFQSDHFGSGNPWLSLGNDLELVDFDGVCISILRYSGG
jgi:hypothetical protein